MSEVKVTFIVTVTNSNLAKHVSGLLTPKNSTSHHILMQEHTHNFFSAANLFKVTQNHL